MERGSRVYDVADRLEWLGSLEAPIDALPAGVRICAAQLAWDWGSVFAPARRLAVPNPRGVAVYRSVSASRNPLQYR